MHVIIPLVQAGSKEVNSVFACSVLGDSVTINLIREANYKNYGFSEATTLNARKVTGLMMYMQNHLFSTTSFFVRDGRIFGGINADSSKTGIVRFKKLAGGGNANRTESSYTKIEICYETCCNCGVLGNGGLTCTETCTSYTIYTSTGGGSGPGSGAGGSNDNYGTGTGGGNGNGAGGHTEIPDGSPVISVAQLVRESAGLTQSEFDFINDWNFLSEACWNYITNGDGLFNDTDKKRMVRSHIQFAMQNDAYFEFALAHYQSLFANNGSATLWFHKDYLLPAKQVLRKNIEVLKLDVVQAYYLNNNVDINGQIKQFLDESEYTKEAKTAAKVAIDVANAGILNTPTSPLHYSIAANYFPPCCPTGPILGSQYIAHISGRMAVLHAQGECNYFFTCYAMAVKEVIQTGLDVIELIPIVGEVADVTNGVIYTISGDLTNASLSFLATIPIAGWTATGTKWAQKVIKLTPSSKGLKLNWYKVVSSTG